MDAGFVKAESTNLPKIDAVMFAKFFVYNTDFFSAGILNSYLDKRTYGANAVGYVQLKRDQQTCIVNCKICPEHKVRSKPYTCTLTVDEQEDVKSVVCHDCPVSEGCKHAVAFLIWCHRGISVASSLPACFAESLSFAHVQRADCRARTRRVPHSGDAGRTTDLAASPNGLPTPSRRENIVNALQLCLSISLVETPTALVACPRPTNLSLKSAADGAHYKFKAL
ncbi:hypothetical protein ACJJTC_013621 [Scirpophaga incertulas]